MGEQGTLPVLLQSLSTSAESILGVATFAQKRRRRYGPGVH